MLDEIEEDMDLDELVRQKALLQEKLKKDGIDGISDEEMEEKEGDDGERARDNEERADGDGDNVENDNNGTLGSGELQEKLCLMFMRENC